MSKKPASKRKTSQRTRTRSLPRIRFWPALIGGLLLVLLGGFLWLQSSQVVFNSNLLRKLPKDSSVAGVARLSQFDQETTRQLSQSTKTDPATVTALLQVTSASGANRELLEKALDDQFAFARTNRGDLTVFTVAEESAFTDLSKRLSGQTSGAKVAERQAAGGTFKIWQAAVNGTNQTVFAYRTGRELYLATNPELIIAASREDNGFTSLDQFADVSEQLAPGADAYVFLNVSQLREPPIAFPLTGVAVVNQKDKLKLSVRVAEPPVITTSLRSTNGSLLPAASLATVSIEGTNVLEYLRVLEEQRQESDLPRVIALQNGIASLNRTLGVNLQEEIFAQATGKFVYARYRTTDGNPHWFGAIEFESPEVANARVAQLTKLLRERVKVPTRREILRQLPDGTQSREVVSEGNEPLEVTDVIVEGKGGNAATFPSMGSVNWVVDGKYLTLGSTPEAVSRMIKTIATPTQGVGERGELSVRAKLADVSSLLNQRDGLFNWILAAQPESGTFTLSKSTGELQGAVRFSQAKQ